MNSSDTLQALVLVLIALSLVACGGGEKYLTVSQVWRDAASLEGERIRVRGQADFRFLPYHPMQVGGCSLDQDVVDNSPVVGNLVLFDKDSHDSDHRLSISDSSLQCEGNVCGVVCKPFAPSAEALWSGAETIEAFEFVGILTISHQQGDVVLILEDIDLKASQRMADGEWGPIPIGDFTYIFP